MKRALEKAANTLEDMHNCTIIGGAISADKNAVQFDTESGKTLTVLNPNTQHAFADGIRVEYFKGPKD